MHPSGPTLSLDPSPAPAFLLLGTAGHVGGGFSFWFSLGKFWDCWTQEGVAAALELLMVANVVSTLNISSTGCFVEPVLLALSKGLCDHLACLRLGHNKFSAK
jgi:hypothetical protein